MGWLLMLVYVAGLVTLPLLALVFVLYAEYRHPDQAEAPGHPGPR